jgi:hypothetical protein
MSEYKCPLCGGNTTEYTERDDDLPGLAYRRIKCRDDEECPMPSMPPHVWVLFASADRCAELEAECAAHVGLLEGIEAATGCDADSVVTLIARLRAGLMAEKAAASAMGEAVAMAMAEQEAEIRKLRAGLEKVRELLEVVETFGDGEIDAEPLCLDLNAALDLAGVEHG